MADKTERQKAEKNVAENRKAFHDYHILETFEAGVALLGTEVKAIREGRVNLRDSFGRVEDGEVFVMNVHISPYSHRGYADHEPLRRRKLLLHKQEIRKLVGKTTERGMTLVPLRIYFKNGRVKLAIGLAKGKKEYDRRETIKRRETDRETRAAVKERQRVYLALRLPRRRRPCLLLSGILRACSRAQVFRLESAAQDARAGFVGARDPGLPFAVPVDRPLDRERHAVGRFDDGAELLRPTAAGTRVELSVSRELALTVACTVTGARPLSRRQRQRHGWHPGCSGSPAGSS